HGREVHPASAPADIARRREPGFRAALARGGRRRGRRVIFTETAISGAFVIEPERREDSRGYFARAFCQDEFADHGLKPVVAQANIAFNKRKGTVRGMHFQYPPAPETKLVRATRGSILDIIVDLRPESATYLQHI